MNNNNMINPANYYNPFAKYNYTSKTRGIYIPKDSEPLLSIRYENNSEKSTSIYSQNYDPETDLLNSMEKENNNSNINTGILGFINNLFGSDNN